MIKKSFAIIFQESLFYSNFLAECIKDGIASACSSNVKFYDIENLDPQNLNNHDSLIFGSPTYFGNVSANMKKFMDSTSDLWKKKSWRNKIAAGFTYSSAPSGDKLSTLMQIFTFTQQHGMLWVGLDLECGEKLDNIMCNKFGGWIGLMAKSSTNTEIAISDKKTANYFGYRIAKLTERYE